MGRNSNNSTAADTSKADAALDAPIADAPAPIAPTVDPDSELGKARAGDEAGTDAEGNPPPDTTGDAAPAGTDPSNEIKLSVKTTGEFMLHDPYTLDTVHPGDACEVRDSAFIQDKLASGQLVEA